MEAFITERTSNSAKAEHSNSKYNEAEKDSGALSILKIAN